MEYAPDHAELYDLLMRTRGKDYRGEAKTLVELATARAGRPGSLLDVGCGTGAHLAGFAELVPDVAGVDVAEGMLAVAAEQLPGVPLHLGSMREFDLGRTFDLVVCLGNAVACMPTARDLRGAVAAMGAHVAPGGVLIAEPWWFPDGFLEGHVAGHLVEEEGRIVSRVSHARRVGDVTHHEVHFTVADSAGVRGWDEVLKFTLFEPEEYVEAFRAAGFVDVELAPALTLSGGRRVAPGLFVGVRR